MQNQDYLKTNHRHTHQHQQASLMPAVATLSLSQQSPQYHSFAASLQMQPQQRSLHLQAQRHSATGGAYHHESQLSYLHLQPTNQNLIHKHHHHHHHHHHHQPAQQSDKLVNYAAAQQSIQNQLGYLQDRSTGAAPIGSLTTEDSLAGPNAQAANFRPRVGSASLASASSSATTSASLVSQSMFAACQQPSRFATRSTSFSSPGSRSSSHSDYQQQLSPCYQPVQQQQQQLLHYNQTPHSPASSGSSLPSSQSISPSDALNLGINLEQYISKRNERERSRVRNVNDAFDNLKNSLPLDLEKLTKRMSKVEILRTAISYIRNLEEVLGYKQEEEESGRRSSSVAAAKQLQPMSFRSSVSNELAMNELSSLLQMAVNSASSPSVTEVSSSSQQSTSPSASELVDQMAAAPTDDARASFYQSVQYNQLQQRRETERATMSQFRDDNQQRQSATVEQRFELIATNNNYFNDNQSFLNQQTADMDGNGIYEQSGSVSGQQAISDWQARNNLMGSGYDQNYLN